MLRSKPGDDDQLDSETGQPLREIRIPEGVRLDLLGDKIIWIDFEFMDHLRSRIVCAHTFDVTH